MKSSWFYIILYFHIINGLLTELEKKKFCQNLRCDKAEAKVCGIRKENGTITHKLFDSECLLLKYGCQVDQNEAYGIRDMKHCVKQRSQESVKRNCPINCEDEKQTVCGIRQKDSGFNVKIFTNKCQLIKYNCEQEVQFQITDFFICTGVFSNGPVNRRNADEKQNYTDLVKKGENYFFDNETEALHMFHSSSKETNSTETEKVTNKNNYFIKATEELNDFHSNSEETNSTEGIHGNRKQKKRKKIKTSDLKTNKKEIITDEMNSEKTIHIDNHTLETNNINNAFVERKFSRDKNQTKNKNVVIMTGSRADFQNINETIDTFFAKTHVLDLPLRDAYPNVTAETRRMLVKIFGPLTIYTPVSNVPKEFNEDHYHRPTINSCYHKCPTKCPDTYAPVCGKAGHLAREPSLMFQNHCYMDVAQCKMFWEDKSDTAQSSAYIESQFLFCIGPELDMIYRYLPLIRTLQHMGRLKNRGVYKYKMKNMKFFNELARSQVRAVG